MIAATEVSLSTVALPESCGRGIVSIFNNVHLHDCVPGDKLISCFLTFFLTALATTLIKELYLPPPT